jgi:hypothetical protein
LAIHRQQLGLNRRWQQDDAMTTMADFQTSSISAKADVNIIKQNGFLSTIKNSMF